MRQAYAHLNLERNPFGAFTREERARIAVFDAEQYIEPMQAGRVVEFVGDHGRGKSVRLQGLALRLDGVEYRRVYRDDSWDRPEGDGPLLIDEIQFLGRRRRHEVWCSGRPVAVATHRTLAEEIGTTGRDVRTVDLDEPVGVDRLRAIFQRRVEACRRGTGSVPSISEDALRHLRRRHGSNLRAVQDHLYEVFHELEELRAVDVDDVRSVEPPDPEIDRAVPSHRP